MKYQTADIAFKWLIALNVLLFMDLLAKIIPEYIQINPSDRRSQTLLLTTISLNDKLSFFYFMAIEIGEILRRIFFFLCNITLKSWEFFSNDS